MKTRTILVCCVFFTSLFCAAGINGQNEKKTLRHMTVIKGRVIDAATKKPLPFASITLKGSYHSNVTNGDGIFSFKISEPAANDSLKFGFMGYRDTTISVASLKEGTHRQTIRLKSTEYKLNTVYIHPHDGLSLFKAVFDKDNIAKNYPNRNEVLTTFYRETIKRGSKFVTLNEAILDILKRPYFYDNVLPDMIAIYKGRGDINYRITDTLFMSYKSGAYSSLDIDLARSPFLATTVETAPSYYNFKVDPMIIEGNTPVYILEFNQKPGMNEPLYKGKLYIEGNSMAIMRAEFEMNVAGYPNAYKYFLKNKPSGVSLKVNNAKYIINYKIFDGKWHFDYSRIELNFTGKYKGKWLSKKYSVISEMAVTGYNDSERYQDKMKAFRKEYQSNKLRPSDILAKKLSNFDNQDFWQNYNIIQPDESVYSIIKKIKRQLKHRE
ncbi:MAG: carboxypeptidase-like regulatory domain-containing protein [Bacteroidales bacterium]|jgi:hypothetical protein|nr:carboxypeptidase-like regulatory domain-containing protein [Bacteroidales bacterium]